MNGRTIGGLAQETGLPASTLRYYERIGLLMPEGRSPANHRRYGPQSLRKLRLILEARDLGLSLSQVQALLGAKCGRVQQVLQKKIGEVETSIARLSSVRRRLKKALGVCRSAETAGLCGKLDGI